MCGFTEVPLEEFVAFRIWKRTVTTAWVQVYFRLCASNPPVAMSDCFRTASCHPVASRRSGVVVLSLKKTTRSLLSGRSQVAAHEFDTNAISGFLWGRITYNRSRWLSGVDQLAPTGFGYPRARLHGHSYAVRRVDVCSLFSLWHLLPVTVFASHGSSSNERERCPLFFRCYYDHRYGTRAEYPVSELNRTQLRAATFYHKIRRGRGGVFLYRRFSSDVQVAKATDW